MPFRTPIRVRPDLDVLPRGGGVWAEVQAHDVDIARPTEHRAMSRRDLSIGLASALVGGGPATMSPQLMVRLQRAAGNGAVAELVRSMSSRTAVQRCPGGCDCHAAGRGQATVSGDIPESPEIQRLSADLQVKGKFEGAASHPKQVFFDFNTAGVDSEERAKIDTFRQTAPPPAELKAIASEEGGAAANEPLARRRGAAVASIIGESAPRPAVAVALEVAVDNPDYRFMRRVDLAPPSSSQEDECVLDPACETRLVQAVGLAKDLAEQGRSAAQKREGLDDAFHASDDKTAGSVVKAYDGVIEELKIFAKPNGHSCQTPCTDPTCAGGIRAFLDRKTNTLVSCPSLTDTGKTVAETILHEAVHGPQVKGEDSARIFEPLFPFLTTETALQNPDSYVEHTRAAAGSPTTPRAATGAFDASMSADQQAAVTKATAWAIRRLLAAGDDAFFLYGALADAHKNPGEADRLDNFANERTLLKKEHFGTTAPPTTPKIKDQWIVEGVSNRLHKLVVAVGSQPTVTRGTSVRWSRKKNVLQVNRAFFDADVSQQARLIEFALILNDPDIPGFRAASYQRVVDLFGGLDVSITEGHP